MDPIECKVNKNSSFDFESPLPLCYVQSDTSKENVVKMRKQVNELEYFYFAIMGTYDWILSERGSTFLADISRAIPDQLLWHWYSSRFIKNIVLDLP